MIIVSKGYATKQISDYLIYNNDTLYLYESPLEKIDRITFKIQKMDSIISISSGCWRGFYAEWRIIDNILYLANVYDCKDNKLINHKIEKILKRKFNNGLIKADWVNGYYWAGKDFVDNLMSIYLSVYKHEIRFEIKNGKLINNKEFNYIQCDIHDKEKITDFVIKNIDWVSMPLLERESINISTELSLNQEGKILDIKIIKSNNQRYNNQVISILKQLPCMTVYFREGIIYNNKEWVTIEIPKR